MIEAAQGLLYPDIYSRSKPENADQFVVLPNSFAPFLGKFPELTPFLIGQAKANPPNFLHNAMVGDVSRKIGQDLIRLFPSELQIFLWSAIEPRLAFAYVHDNGKPFVGHDFLHSDNLVHPDKRFRPSEDNGWHWAHPAFGAIALQSLSQVAPEHMRGALVYWSHQTAVHHREFIPFARELTDSPMQSFRSLDWTAHTLFTLADVSVAMGMSRPGSNGVYDNAEILSVLLRKHLSDDHLRPFVPRNLDTDFVRSYLIQSLFSHLDELRASFSPTDCVSPAGFVADGFWVDCRTDSVELEQLARFSRALRHTHEKELLDPIKRMDRAGVLILR